MLYYKVLDKGSSVLSYCKGLCKGGLLMLCLPVLCKRDSVSLMVRCSVREYVLSFYGRWHVEGPFMFCSKNSIVLRGVINVLS